MLKGERAQAYFEYLLSISRAFSSSCFPTYWIAVCPSLKPSNQRADREAPSSCSRRHHAVAPHLNPSQAETRGPSRLKGKGYDLGGRRGPTSFVDEALPVTEPPDQRGSVCDFDLSSIPLIQKPISLCPAGLTSMMAILGSRMARADSGPSTLNSRAALMASAPIDMPVCFHIAAVVVPYYSCRY